MNLLRNALLAAVATFALGGCTINFQASAGSQQPQAQPTTAQQRQTTPRKIQDPSKTTTKTPSTGTTTPTSSAPAITQRIIFGNGTAGAFRGHAYVVPNSTQKIPDLSKLTPFATLFTDSFIIQPQNFSGGFPGALVQEEWFAIRYQGAFEVPTDATYRFKLTSDDGANLYIDGEKILDNDGLHGAKDATASKALKAGKHQLQLDYLQAQKGSVALMLSIASADGALAPLVGVR
jgi:hypothetical protein